MPHIALVVDSSNDLPPDILLRHRIRVVPLLIRFGEDEHLDAYERREIFRQRFASGEIPRTAAPSPDAFGRAFRSALQESEQVIAMTVTSKHSSTYNSALLAAREFDGRVHVFDSWSISLGVGLLALRAAENIARGMNVPAILADLEDARRRQHLILYLDSLDAIQRGGRLAPAMSAIKRMSSMLSIKLILSTKEGEFAYAGAVRSPRKGMAHIMHAIAGRGAESVAVAHTRAPELAAMLADGVASALDFPRPDILSAEAGPVLGVHGGFRAFGVTFIAQK
jgi:DegV family protein with EDD domain